MSEQDGKKLEETKAAIFNLGAWMGRHHAFGMIANRCSAADAECLKTIRDGEKYKELGLTWDQFCTRHLGAGRTYIEKQIHCFEEFGPKYHRFVEAMPLSPATYRLIEGSVTEQGLEHNGEVIPITRENRAKLAAAVDEVRSQTTPPTQRHTMTGARQCLKALIDAVHAVSNLPERRMDLIGFLDYGCSQLQSLSHSLKQK